VSHVIADIVAWNTSDLLSIDHNIFHRVALLLLFLTLSLISDLRRLYVVPSVRSRFGLFNSM